MPIHASPQLVPPTRPEVAASPDPALAVETRALWKSYRNPWTLQVTRGVEALDLAVRRGEVVGYLGPNGAGKTTTIKILTGLHKATQGRAWVLGQPVEDPVSRRRLGFLPEQPYFYDYLNGVEYLELAGRLSGLTAAEARTSARRWLGRVGLGEHPSRMLRKYSKGMLQRLGLAAALVHEPELLILDEPMSGLDPFGRRDVRELIMEQRARGTTVLFSSHILPDVEMLCDRVAIVLQGRLERVATLDELTRGGRQEVDFRCSGRPMLEVPATLAPVLQRIERVQETVFRLSDDSRQQETLAWLVSQRVEIMAVTPQRASLEQLFMAAAAGRGTGDPETERRSA
ncbi:MAG: ABC transporter ATP-binding protein [Candidatus Eisenbacteria bacterium]